MAKISENSITSLTDDWANDKSNGLPYSGKAVQDFIKKQFTDLLNETETKYGYSEFTDGALIFYDKEGGTELSRIQFSGTNYVIDFGTAKNITVLTSDESYLLPITPKSYSIELGSTVKEEFVEDYTFKIEVDTGKGFNDLNIQDNTIKFGETKHVDIRKMLVVGINRVRVIVTGVQSKLSKAIVYNTTLTSLTLECFHAWNNVWFSDKDYKINNIFFSGNVKKDLHVEIDGVECEPKSFTANAEYKNVPYEFDVTGKLNLTESLIIPIKIWIESDNVKTKVYSFNIMYVSSKDPNKALVCVNNVPEQVYNFELETLFSYAVYNLSEVTISIDANLNGEIIKNIFPEKTLTNLQPLFKYQESLFLQINTESINNLFINYTILNISNSIPLNNSNAYLAESGAVFYMNPSLRSNQTLDREVWYNSADNTKISAIWDKFTFTDDAWLQDTEANRALVVKAGSKVTVDYKPFLPTSGNSKTFEFMFRVSNIADYDTPILTIINKEKFDLNDRDCVGLVLYPTKLLIITDNERLELFQQLLLSENRIIHIAVVVQRNYASNSATNLIRIYINGCENVTFAIQNSSKLYNVSDYNKVCIGQLSSDFYLYMMRLYDRALSGQQIINNYLNALIETYEISRKGIKNDNSIVDGGAISYDMCKNIGYNTLVIETDKEIPSLDNPNTDNLRVNMLLEYNDYPEWNVLINNTPIDGQGTTSSKYAKWNLRNKVDKNATWIYPNLNNKTENGKEGYIAGYGLNPKVSKITFKKNIASQPQGHKMGATAFYNDLFKKVLGDVYISENFPSSDVRVAVYQHPFIGFQKFSNGTYKFIGLYTGGPDKTDKKTFGYNKVDEYPNLMMIEGPNHDPLLTRFLIPWTDDVFYDKKQETLSVGDPDGSYQEGWDADIAGDFDTEEDDLLPLYKSEFKPAYDAIYFNSIYIASLAEANALNILNDDFDIGKFWENNTEVVFPDGSIKSFSNKLLSFYDENYNLIYYRVKTGKYEILSSHNLLEYLKLSGTTPTTTQILNARMLQWKTEVGKYVSLYEAYFHNCFCELIGASDNDAKNTYWRKFKSLTEGGIWGFLQDDLDTIFLNDNNGQDTKNYFAEHNDVNANGGDIFQGRTSAFWSTLREICKVELQDSMHKIVQQALVIAEQLNLTKSTKNETLFNLIKYYFWDHSSKYFSATAYNEDTQWGYIDVWYKEPSKLYNNVPPLTQIHGDHFETEYDWVEKRIAYIFSKYQIGAYEALDGDGYGTLEFTCAEQCTLNITPAISQYPRVSYGGALTLPSNRTIENETYSMTLEASGETALYIKGLDWISDLGDLSILKLSSRGGSTEIPFSVIAKRILSLNLGSDSPKFNCTNLKVESPAIEILNARNVNTINTVVDLKSCPRIREIDLSGTQIPLVVLPVGGRVEKLYLPETVSTLVLNNLLLLTDFSIASYSNLETIYCHSNNSVDILQGILNTQNNKLKSIGIVWDTVITVSDSTILTLLANLTEKIDGKYKYSSAYVDELGTLRTDDTFETPPNIQGTLYIDNYVYERDVEKLKSHLNNLKVIYNPDKLYIPFEDSEFEKLVADTYGDGVGVTQEQLDGVTEFKREQFASDIEVRQLTDLYKFTNLKKIGSDAFGSNVETIIIPDSVDNCNFLHKSKSVTTKVIAGKGLKQWTITKEYSKLPKVVIPDNIISIYNTAFMSCSSLKKIALGSGITEVKGNAFTGVTLNEVYLQSLENYFKITFNSIWNVSSNFFMYKGIPEEIKNNTENYGNIVVDYNWDKLEGTGDYEGQGTRVKVTTEMVNEALKEVTEIKDNVCKGMTQLEGELVIPDNITSIGDEAFQDCSGLTSIEIPNSVTSIGNGAFHKCTLENFTIEDTSKITSMTNIGTVSIKNLYVNDLKPLYRFSFRNFKENSTTNIYVNGELVQNVFIDYIEGVNNVTGLFKSSTITSAKIAEGYTTANSGPFEGCSKIQLVDFPSTIQSINWIRYMKPGMNLVVRAVIPPSTSAFFGTYSNIYVPDESVDAYKDATGWNAYENKIFPIQKDSLPLEAENATVWTDIELIPGAIATPEIGSVHTFAKTNSDTIYSAIIDLTNVDFVKINGIMNNSTNRFWCLVDENNVVTAVSDIAAYYDEGLVPISVNDRKMSKLIVNLDKSIYNNAYVKTGDSSNYYVRFEDYAFLKLISSTEVGYGDGYGVTQEQLDGVTTTNGIRANIWAEDYTITDLGDLYKLRNLTTIDQYSFNSCKKLVKVLIPDTVNVLSNGAFNGCTSLKDVVIGNGVTSIGNVAFANSIIEDLVIPENVKTLKYGCFSSNGLKRVLFKGVTNFDEVNIFDKQNSINFIYIDTINNWLNSNNIWTILEDAPNAKLYIGTIDDVKENRGIYGDITVGYDWDKLEGTGDYADKGEYEGKRQLVTTLMVNEALKEVTEIKNNACYNMTQLEGELVIPDNITSIGGECFNNCTNINKIKIPNSIERFIAGGAFYNCTNAVIEDLNLPNLIEIGGGHNFNSTKLKKISNLGLLTSICTHAFSSCKELSSVTIPNSVTSIGDYAFYNCTSLTSITIPNSVTSIGLFAFNAGENGVDIHVDDLNKFLLTSAYYITTEAKRYKLYVKNELVKEITLPKNVTEYNTNIFCNNQNYYNKVTIPDNILTIGGMDHTNIDTLIIGNGLQYIPYNAFRACKIKTLYLGENIRIIGGYAFFENSISTLICKAITPPDVSADYSIYGVNGNNGIYVPDSSVDAYKNATGWSKYGSKFRPLSEIEGLDLSQNSGISKVIILKATYYGIEITPEYTIEGTAATLDGNILTFNEIGEVTVTATYNDESVSRTYSWDGSVIPIEHGVVLQNNGITTTDSTMSTVGFVSCYPSIQIRWGVTGGTLGNLCEYKEDGAFVDYWGGNQNPRTINVSANSTKVKASFSTAHLANAYIYDVTNGIYLWKGDNVEF